MADLKENEALINRFYEAFARQDADTMNACYGDNIVFEDPAFGRLNADEPKAMWSMLVERAGSNLNITHKVTEVTHGGAKAEWEAIYPFSQTGRKVHNRISAEFIIEEGKIVYHKDRFDLWKWAGMALGTPGKLLGWTGFMKKKIRQMALASLKKYMSR